jgi:UDP-N-acetylmuramoyl-tripeptide--D-alanyl-D-alanine ligase
MEYSCTPCEARDGWIELAAMAVSFTVQEVCEATGGKLAGGNPNIEFTSVTIDSRTVASGALFVPLPGNRTNGHSYLDEAVRQGAGGFFFSPTIASNPPEGAARIAVDDPLIALQKLAAWHRQRLQATVIGIAGSNGKTTTKELLAQVCAPYKKTFATQGNLNNHIGLPLTLLRAERDVECLVLELGTSGVGELATLSQIARPYIGVITTIAEEHTETLRDLMGVIAAETELITALPPDGVAVVNGDHDDLLEAVHRLARCRIVTFGERPTNQYRIANIRVSRTGTSFFVSTPAGEREVQVKLLGSHFALAGTASIAVAHECGVTLDAACGALGNAHGAARRMAVVELCDRRVTILDDCYNANPASMQQAILTVQQVRAFGEQVIFVLGDMLELGDLSRSRHQEIGKIVAALDPRPDILVTVGQDARLIADEVERTGIQVHWFAQSEVAAAFVQEIILHAMGPQLVLVKGSRGVRLEEVTRRLVEA